MIALIPLLRRPEALVPQYLADPPSIKALVRHPCIGWMLLRSGAIVVRDTLMHLFWPGLVMATGSFILQAGTWAGLVYALPPLLRPYHISLSHRQAAVLATLLCGPVWIGGIAFILPEEPLVLLLLSRAVIVTCAVVGARLFEKALHGVHCEAPARLPAVASAAAAYAIVYLALFVVVGIAANIVLYVAKVLT